MSSITENAILQVDSVIFATDFSASSQNAGLYASAISKHFNTKLVIAHAFTLHQAALEVEVEKTKESHQRVILNHDLRYAAESLPSGVGETEPVLLEGDPREVIPVLARLRKHALIVLGTHGGGSIDRFVLGSTAEGILRHSSGPALTVGPRVNSLEASKLNIRRILYATDCTAEAAHAAPVAIALADAFSAELDVLNVIRSREVDHPEQLHRLEEFFYGAVEKVVPHNAGQICEPHTFVSVGHPSAQILEHIREREIDLLVMGLRRNTYLGMQNRTSGVFPIIVEAPCPVITVAFGSIYQP